MTRRERRLQATPEVAKRIGDRIKEAQTEAGFETTEDLARALGISLRLVQKHRAGDNAPSYATLARYAQVLGKPMSWFLEERVAA